MRISYRGAWTEAFLLSFTVWLALLNASSAGKSLANLIEPVFISFAFPVAALIRVGVGSRARESGVDRPGGRFVRRRCWRLFVDTGVARVGIGGQSGAARPHRSLLV
jgi:hypothetical protein